MDRTKVKEVRLAILALIAASTIESDLGITITATGGTFTDNSYKLKLEATENAADGSTLTPDANDFLDHVRLYGFTDVLKGLTAESLGKSFVWGGTTYKLVGFRPRATKNMFVGKDRNGKPYIFPKRAVDSLRAA